jgi:hypothetical protein
MGATPEECGDFGRGQRLRHGFRRLVADSGGVEPVDEGWAFEWGAEAGLAETG